MQHTPDERLSEVRGKFLVDWVDLRVQVQHDHLTLEWKAENMCDMKAKEITHVPYCLELWPRGSRPTFEGNHN